MKEFINDFLKLQNDRMKSPFFSAVVLSLLFYNWDLIYFIISSNFETVSKIEYVKKELTEKSLWHPFILTIILLILPVIVNNVVQSITDYFVAIRTNKLIEYKIARGKGELNIANLEAEKSFSTNKIELEVKNNIASIIDKNASLENSLYTYKGQLDELKLSLESERKASEESREHSSFLVSELESAKSEILALKDELAIKKRDIVLLKKHPKPEGYVMSRDGEIFSSEDFVNNGENINFTKKYKKDFVNFYTTQEAFADEAFGLDDDSVIKRADIIANYFNSKLAFELFEILKDRPMSTEALLNEFPKGKHSIEDVFISINELVDSRIAEKTSSGICFITSYGKNIASKLK